jgi:hypothetical protein
VICKSKDSYIVKYNLEYGCYSTYNMRVSIHGTLEGGSNYLLFFTVRQNLEAVK